ncbi:hypothetical protein LEP1GSC168_1710 [Leptospira santarosai str. HAI134]|nr:hypothetical protein LEP1GSC169_3549 [Leptospira santarosai str. HAI1349]EMO23721.1 hypothetical protein LEP1GSC168_1710 [Leptospira santarosai str. HAI134]EMO72317.1 hypothetical protein LEP1GSC130_0211 [Leptospira santarosai str. 200403458]EMO98646.1 hypothetical protein LEP1GSC120_1442 [Leptospira santarosai str. 200702252]
MGTPTKSELHANFIVKNSFKSVKRRNLWELPRFQVLDLK